MSLCNDCKKREATVKITQVVGAKNVTMHLCNECAAARGFHSPLDQVPFPLKDILANMVKSPTQPISAKASGEPIACESCGLEFDEFTRLGRFGCGGCYRAFRPRIESIMRKIHGASLHRGMNPMSALGSSGTSDALPVQEEARLQQELKKAIATEDFERAAELRDKIRLLKEQIEANETEPSTAAVDKAE